jgi:hypothetical protein
LSIVRRGIIRRLEARLNFINHAEVIDEFYAAREGEMRVAIGGMKNVDGVQAGRGDVGPAHACSLENDEQSSEDSHRAHGKTGLPQHWQPAEPVALGFARAESLIENFGDERGRGRFRLKSAKAADDMRDLREKRSALRASVDMRAELTLFGGREKAVEVVAEPFFDLYAGPGHFSYSFLLGFLLVMSHWGLKPIS